jgi:ribosomal protein S18 acetylase RimI-like enzyme
MSPVRPLHHDDLAPLRELFRDFPFKARQQRAQGLDPERLADFFTQAEERALDAQNLDHAPTLLAGEENGALTAFAAVRADRWHAAHYPFRFGRLAPVLAHRASDSLRNALLDAALQAARERGMQHLIARIDGAEYPLMQAMVEHGFHVVDASVKMSARMADLKNADLSENTQRGQVREYREGDLDAVRRIAATSHPLNHYYNDPWLAPEDTHNLLAAWVEKCCRGTAHVRVLERDESVAGFAIYLTPTGLNKAMGTRIVVLDFVCLASEAQGAGLGRWFVRESLRGLAGEPEIVELRTSHHNLAALACYEALGMRIVSTDFVLHRHEESFR